MTSAYQACKLAGYACLPVKADKSPASPTWPVDEGVLFLDAHGIGIACGKRSGGVECLDFDNHFHDAKANLSAFVEAVQSLYDAHPFCVCSTKSGGYHLLYRCSEVEGNQKLAQRSKDGRPVAILETRGEGGYFCAAPTPGYKILRGRLLKLPEITLADRSQLMAAARSMNEFEQARPTEWERSEKPGDKFNALPEAPGMARDALSAAGWTPIRAHLWRRPGKAEGISATFGKVAPGIFYCFTANGSPFEGNRAYSPFQVLALLEHRGDFSECAKKLAKELAIPKSLERRGIAATNGAGKKHEALTTERLDAILSANLIDWSKEELPPTPAMKVRDFANGALWDKRLFTLGNFSGITGKAKAKKSFLATVFLAAAASGQVIGGKIVGSLPPEKYGVLLFDTEQGDYDSWHTARRVVHVGGTPHNYGAYRLREFTPMERCEIIAQALKLGGGRIGLVVIDGIADLATAMNDEEEATRVVSLLMKWTKLYDCHIVTVIHQNKANNYATGHVGSAIMKKCEAIISVEKIKDDRRCSKVSCDMIRGVSEFEDFTLRINEQGLPEIPDMENLASYEILNDPF